VISDNEGAMLEDEIMPGYSHIDYPEPGFQEGSIFSYSTVSIGDNHACALLENGSVMCWGYGGTGALGFGEWWEQDSNGNMAGGPHPVPEFVRLPEDRMAVSVVVEGQNSCAILDTGELVCWGYNWWGQIGDGTQGSHGSGNAFLPRYVSLQQNVVEVATSGRFTCAILDDASVKCWGNNEYGTLGDGTLASTNKPYPTEVNLPSGHGAVAIATTSYNACAVLDNGSVMCWGTYDTGLLGEEEPSEFGPRGYTANPIHIELPVNRTAVSIAMSSQTACIIMDNGSLGCWGENSEGQIGDGTTIDRNSLVLSHLPDNRTAIAVSLSDVHSCAILDNYSKVCWSNLFSSDTQSLIPVYDNHPSGRTTLAISVAGLSKCSILDNYSISCIGRPGDYGRLGDGTRCTQTWETGCGWNNGLGDPSYVSLPIGSSVLLYDRDFDEDGILNIFDTNIPGDHDGDGFVDSLEDYPGNPTRSVNCGDGFYGQFVCRESWPGHYAVSGSMYQSPCPRGEYQSNSGQTSCLESNAGYYAAPAGSTSQSQCELGTYQPETRQPSCIFASAGNYVSAHAAVSQSACPEGTYNPLNGSTSLDACLNSSPGHFSNDSGMPSHIPCEPGTFQPMSGQTSCIISEPGYYVQSHGSSVQQECQPGTYNPEFGSTDASSCIQTEPGYFTQGSASVIQSACDYGAYQPESGKTECILATPGYYVDSIAATFQMEVPLDYYTDSLGSIGPVSCPALHITLYSGSTSVDECLIDSDSDRLPNSDDFDDDNDAHPDVSDAFPLDPAEWIDSDGDGIGDNADKDDDNDGWEDSIEFICDSSDPLDADSFPEDWDGDGICDLIDLDDDNDGISDSREYDIGTNPLNSDTDDDGVSDMVDQFPLDPSEWDDSDADGVGDNSDAVPSIARYQTYGDLAFDLVIVTITAGLVAFMFVNLRSKNSGGSEEE